MIGLALISITWTSYTNANGVWQIAQKADTFYMATTGGLVVFHPETRTVSRIFTNLDGLPSVVLTGVALDGHYRPWVLCLDEGLAYYNGTGFSRYSSLCLPVADPQSVKSARGIWARDNWIFIATKEGLVALDTKGTVDTSDDGSRLLDSEFFVSDSVNAVYFVGDSFFVASDSGLFMADFNDNWISETTAWTRIYPYRPVYAVLSYANRLWIGTNKGLRFENDALIGPYDVVVTAVAQRSDSVFFNTMENGVWVMGQDTLFAHQDSVVCISIKTGDELYRGTKCPKALFAGPQGVWVGFGWIEQSSAQPHYFTGGFASYENHSWNFVSLSGLPFGLIGTMATTPDGSVWMGIPQPAQYRASFVRFKNGQWDTLSSVHHILSMQTSPDGKLFVGCFGQGVYQVDLNGEVVNHWGSDQGLSHSIVIDMGTDLSGNILVAGIYADGYAYRIAGGAVEHLDGVYVASGPQAIDMAPDGTIWYGTTSGIHVFQQTGNTWAKITEFHTSDGLPSDDVNFLERTRQGMWIGTANGLVFYSDGSFHTLLEGKKVLALEQEFSGDIWVWTDNGLYKMDTLGTVLNKFIPGDSPLVGDGDTGMEIYEIRDALVLVPALDQLWVGTDKGISVLGDLGNKQDWTEGVFLYPNPLYLRDGRAFKLGNAIPGSSVDIFTLDGYHLLGCVLDETLEVQLPEGITPGLYLVLIKPEGRTKVLKLVVQ